MGDTFYLKPSNPAFKKHKGEHSMALLEKVLNDYGKYVTGEGRKISKESWVGTAMQESTLGKYAYGGKRPGGVGLNKYNVGIALSNPSKHDNVMFALPDRDYYLKNQKRFAPDWAAKYISDGRDVRTPEVDQSLYDQAAYIAKITGKKNLGNVMRKHLFPYIKISATKDSMARQGWNDRTDFAAQKLQEGLDKFKTPEKASRWYNVHDPVPREAIPQLGKEILSNPRVKQFVKEYLGKAQ